MRICLISHEYSGTFAYHLSHGLKEIGHEVEVVSLAANGNELMLHEGIKVHRVLPFDFASGLSILNMCMPLSRNALRIASALWSKALQLHKDKPFEVIDVPEFLAQGIYPAATNIAPLIIRLYAAHSKFTGEHLHNVKPSFDQDLTAAFERMSMLTADALIAPNKDLAQYAADDLNISSDQIHIIPNPVELELQRGEIARQTVEIYQTAIKSFATRYRSTLYLKPPQILLSDVEEFVYGFDKAIGDFLYFNSWQFRIRHWYKLRQSPKLIAAKIYMKVSSLMSKIIGKQKTTAKLIRLKEEIDLKQDVLRRHEVQDKR